MMKLRRQWALTTQAGDTVVARFCIMATGMPVGARIPDFPGMADYRGRIHHTGTLAA
jgi:cation diffusion facilitator CzcD-associated flavoprotein CzcO